MRAMSDATTTPLDVRAALLAENARFAELVRSADHTADVPTCPGWTLTQLYRHVGRGHRWAATMVATRATEGLDPRQVPDGKPPADLDGTLDWLTASPRTLLDAVDTVGPDVPVWTFTGPKPAAWWIRRRLHEETAHRADAQLAVGVEPDLSAELAADGLSEWLDLLAARPGEPPLAAGTSLHLHATDVAGEWTVRPQDEGIAWEHGHEKATAGIRGPATVLFLAMLRRLPADDPRLEIHGDAATWQTWLASTGF
jgi:uncharacterized protein (TIGR03083 family)